MYINFTWLRNQLPPHSKIIVWAATVHTAKELDSVHGSQDRVPLGSYIHKDFKDAAYSLGFTAYSGSYAFAHRPLQQLSIAPPDSLEAQTFAHNGTSAAYLTSEQLRGLDEVPARLLGTQFETARWDQVVDGIVVFREERSPSWIKPAIQ